MKLFFRLFIAPWLHCAPRLLLLCMLVTATQPMAALPVTPLAVGELHSLALSSSGNIWAWGDNAFGQLGDGTTTNRATAVKVKGLDNSAILIIAAGGYHSLALDNHGNVYSWGSNFSGELGNGNHVSSSTPTQITSLTGISQIAAGYNFSLAVDGNQNVWAWGDNEYGQLGIGSTAGQSTPVRITALNHIIAIAASGYHAWALDKNNNLYAWGDNTFGELGDGSQLVMSTTPELITVKDAKANVLQCTSISTGLWQSYCITSTKELFATGRNDSFQLGIPSSTAPVVTPTQVTFTVASNASATKTLAHIFAGDGQAFAQTAASAGIASAVWYWGINTNGQLGDDDQNFGNVPSPMVAKAAYTTTNASNLVSSSMAVGGLKYIAGGAYHAVGTTASGVVYAWGAYLSPESPDSYSILGLGSDPSNAVIPHAVQSVNGSGQMNLLTDGTTLGSITTPNQFSFASAKNVPPATLVRSKEIVIAGLSNDAKADIKVQDLDATGAASGGDSAYSINSGTFTSSAATAAVANGDRIVVRHTSSAAYSTQHSTLLTIGGVSAKFTSTTMANPANTSSSGGGGCTVNPGQIDGSLIVLLLAAWLVRRRSLHSGSARY